MKKLIILFFIITITACSVDNEVEGLNNELEQFNLEATTSDDCIWSTYNFENYGTVSVIDDSGIIYVKIEGLEGYAVASAKLHAAKISSKGSRTSNFPTVGNGNLPPGKMEFQKDAEPGSNEIIFELDKSKYDTSEILIATLATFNQGENSFSAWAGNEEGKKGDWLYFQYDLQNCEQCEEEVYAGPDYDITYTTAYQLKELNTGAKINRFFGDLVDAPDFVDDENAVFPGTFEPSIQEYKDGLLDGERNFEIIYTVGEGACEDSATILITVVESTDITITFN